MDDFIDEEGLLTREKAEFMFAFEGAMSVIQETDEPDDDMTRKSSSLYILRQGSQSLATPMGQQS